MRLPASQAGCSFQSSQPGRGCASVYDQVLCTPRRDEKVKVLRSCRPIKLDEVVLGQYTEGNGMEGYLEDKVGPCSRLYSHHRIRNEVVLRQVH